MTTGDRLANVNWIDVEASLWAFGYARLGAILTPDECSCLIGLYSQDDLFRSRIDMARYRFGVGDYKYFANPLPGVVEEIRSKAYPALAPVANRWMEAFGVETRYPPELQELREMCQEAGQTKPTPLLLHYEAGGYNCLHQDLYGDVAFPMQIVCFLSEPEEEYSGGDFLLVEQRPRAQSMGEVVRGRKGEAVVFTTRYRPVKGSRGYYRANVKHGVSRVRSGVRYTLGIIFHDAK